jgi:hypothetical protein
MKLPSSINRGLLSAALLAAAFGCPLSAEAVNVSANGTGQVLIFPYYTVQATPTGQFNTYISIVNTTTRNKAIKVRFLEGHNGREVMNFNVYLTPHDTWVAAITPNAAGGASLAVADKSCIQPVTYAGALIDFYTTNYTGANADGADNTVARTREGWIEAYDMGTVDNPALQAAMHHDSSGTPALCNAFDAAKSTDFGPPTGGLMGGVNLMNVLGGTGYNYDAVGLDDVFTSAMWTRDGSPTPTLADAQPVAKVLSPDTFSIVTSTWPTGYQAVTAALDTVALTNMYSLDSAVAALTDMVMVQPTKRFHTAPGANLAPFSADGCDPVTIKNYDRDGLETTASSALCGSLAVGTFNGTSILNSAYAVNWTVPYQNGTTQISAGQTMSSADSPAVVHGGLPLVGFQVSNFSNGTIKDKSGNSVMANYGFNFQHRRAVSVQ